MRLGVSSLPSSVRRGCVVFLLVLFPSVLLFLKVSLFSTVSLLSTPSPLTLLPFNTLTTSSSLERFTNSSDSIVIVLPRPISSAMMPPHMRYSSFGFSSVAMRNIGQK